MCFKFLVFYIVGANLSSMTRMKLYKIHVCKQLIQNIKLQMVGVNRIDRI